MQFWPSIRVLARRIFRSRRTSVIGALIIALAIVTLVVTYDRRNTESFRASLRQMTEHAADVLGERISGSVDRDVSVLRSLAHAISVSNSQQMTSALASHHLRTIDHFTGLGITSGPKLEALYSAAWRSGISRDELRKSLEYALSRIDNGGSAALLKPQLVPVHGDTFALAMPVLRGTGVDVEGHGLVIAIIDTTRFMRGATANSATTAAQDRSGIDFAIRTVGAAPVILQGSATIADQSPVIRPLAVPGDSWELLVVPAGGWEQVPDNRLWFRVALGFATLAMIVPIFIASLLIAERNRNIDELRARERRLIELSQRFRLAVESAAIGIWSLDMQSQRGLWDAKAAVLHGMGDENGTISVEDMLSCVVPADRDNVETYIFNCMFGMHSVSAVYRVRDGDGIRYLQSAGASYTDAEGNMRITGIVRDVSTDMQMAQSLREAKENSELKNAELELALQELSSRESELEDLSLKLDMALASYNCGIWETDTVHGTQVWDRRMCQLYGMDTTDGRLTTAEWIGRILEEDRAMAMAHAGNQAFYRDNGEALVVRVPQPDGSIRYIRSLGQINNRDNNGTRIVGIAVDVTADAVLTEQLKAAKAEAEARNDELEAARLRIEHNALHDPLTGLPNRRKLDQELDELGGDNGENRRFAILHLDLDRFKQINDTLGHAAGDAMLAHASRLLAENVGKNDLVARIGGDEFVIVARDYTSAAEIRLLANNIISAFRNPITIEGVPCRCGVSIGIALGDTAREGDARAILINADIALYRAKATGRNCYQFFTQNLQAEIISNKRIADEILAGLENGEFVTWYQPQICSRTMELNGAEALIRWNHPTRGILTPEKFLDIAEDLNVVAAMDRLVLETALRDRRLWDMQGAGIKRVSVNVSSRRLHDESLIESLESMAIIPGEVAFELVESIFLDERDEIATSNLDRLKAIGVDIEIDDFGTGHTSIISLLRLKPHRLKIDRQLVMPIISSPQERALVASIIEIAHTLGVETVAEGVESMAHSSMLRGMGCDHLQGYAFARPLPAAEFAAFAKGGQWRKVS